MYYLNDLSFKLLVATDRIPASSEFYKSVVYIHEHNQSGALGIIVNKPLSSTTSKLLPNILLDKPFINNNSAIFKGGPVCTDTLLLLYPSLPEDMPVKTQVSIVSSGAFSDKILLDAMPEHFFSQGFSAWREGQLENEILDTNWLICTYTHELMFNIPAQEKYKVALSSSGIDISNMVLAQGEA